MDSSPTHSLKGKHIILGVTGGIAAYKCAELVRLYKKSGADVQVIMTPSAAKFVTPVTLGTLSEREVLVDIFPENEDGSWTKHVHLGLWADVFVVAPATANTIAKLAYGLCDNMLTAVALSARCPLLVCPAMDHDMYVHATTQRNLDTLIADGHTILPPDVGELASGLIGQGRLPDLQVIHDKTADVAHASNQPKTLNGKKVLVTAGPTREAIDPVRFVTNHSSGKMGYAIAAEAQKRGADVTLVSGPTNLDKPFGVNVVSVTSAADMFDAVMQHGDADVIVMAAAIADYRPAKVSSAKIKKKEGDLHLELERTTDILATLGEQKPADQVLVGFALETNDGPKNARSKLEKKNLDLIVLNNPNDAGSAFGHDTNMATLFFRSGDEKALPLMSKENLAKEIFDAIEVRGVETLASHKN